MKNFTKLKLFSLFFFISVVNFSQTADDYVNQIWFDFNPTYYFSPAFQVSAELGYHRQMDTKGWRQIVFSPFIRTWLGKKMNFYVGIDNTYTFNEVVADRYEFRPYQSIGFRWSPWEFPFRHKVQLEERFDYDVETWDVKKSVRLRYRINGYYRWNEALQDGSYWEANASLEFFMNLWGVAGQFQEQVRLKLAIDRGFNYASFIRFETTLQKEKLFNRDPITDIFLRISWYQSWGRF